MPIVVHSQILLVHAAAVAVGLATKRGALLAGIPQSLRAGLDDAQDPAARLLTDLDGLNDLGRLPDGSLPLQIWLENALALCGSRSEAGVFREVLALVRPPGGGATPSPSGGMASAPTATGGSTFNFQIHGSTIASLAVGDGGAHANGRVDLRQEVEQRAVPTSITASGRGGPRPLVVLGPHVVAEGERVAVAGNVWAVRLYRFLVGDQSDLAHVADAGSNFFPGDRCIVLSEPGEARAMVGHFSWRRERDYIEIQVPVEPRRGKESVDDLEPTLDLKTMQPVQGIAAGPNALHIALGTAIGQASDGFGTWISEWMRIPELRVRLSDLIKIEILRLSSVPRIVRPTTEVFVPLGYVDRLRSVQILPERTAQGDALAEIEVSFVGGGSWKGEVVIATQHFEPPKIDPEHHLEQQLAAMRAAVQHEQNGRRAAAATRGSSSAPTAPAMPAEASVPASVYLSYGDQDLPFARRLYEALEAAGVPIFFREEHDKPGVHQHRIARKGVNEYDHVLLLCSKRSLDDSRVLAELEEILGREHREGGAERIIPIWLDRYVDEGWKPAHPDVVHAVADRTPLHMEGAEGDAAKFEKALKRLLGALEG